MAVDRLRCGVGRLAGDADAVVADRILDLGQPGLGEEPGKPADDLGIGRERRSATAEFTAKLQRAASLDSTSITLASASNASS